MGRFAFVLAFEFVIAPPNYSAVFAGGVPHFGAEESTTVTADDATADKAEKAERDGFFRFAVCCAILRSRSLACSNVAGAIIGSWVPSA